MAGNGTKRKPGRPRKEIDLKRLYKLAKSQLTDAEMGARLGFTREHFCREVKKRPEISHTISKGKSDGLGELREKLFNIAMDDTHDKQITAAIWLAKNYLGMSDRARQEISGPGGEAIKHEVTHDLKGIAKLPDKEAAAAYYHQHIAGRNGNLN